ncbi:MAG: histidine kinase [Ramlibacter sp.]|nr:histidine kinase [Ramlibacter sp.]
MPGTPRRILLAAVALVLAACIAVTWFVLSTPSLGLQFVPDTPEGAKTTHHLRVGRSPDGSPPAGAIALRLQGRNDGLDLQASDLIEEPDFFDQYAEMDGFFARQSRLAALLTEPTLTLHWQATAGAPVQATTFAVAPQRSPGSLPLVFWFQLFAGSASLLIGAWVVALRPEDWGPRMLALCGLMFPLSTYTAAAYSVRELAIDGTVFRWLSTLNHTGALMFGCGLVAIFLTHPRPLVRLRWLWLLPAVFIPWQLADTFRWAADQDWGARIPILTEMLLAIALAAVQWRRSRGRPAERAALRWLALSTLAGSGLFVLMVVSVNVFGLFPPLEQGYAFGFFLIMFFGLALGVGRYRLFDLDEWAYRVLLWALGVALVVLVDALLVLWLRWNATLSLGTTLLVCGALYLPVRQWLWGRLVERGSASVEQMMPELVRIAFSASADERERLWAAALQRLFNPMQSVPVGADGPAPTRPAILDDGLALQLPACGGVGARLLRYRDHGKRLFSGRDAEFTASLCQLMDQAAEGRDAHERGIHDERLRVARDMHDDIGAKLLTLLHIDDPQRQKLLLREAMTQLRSIVRGLAGQAQPFDDFMADLRHVAMERAQANGVRLDWRSDIAPPPDLGARHQHQLRTALSEALSNALRHAGATHLQVQWHLASGTLSVTVTDDGTGMREAGSAGLGLESIRTRMEELGGTARWSASASGGTALNLTLPLAV